jgi:CTP:molybdopterin cytidylyltransferase MocA
VELLDPELEGGAKTVVHRHLDSARIVEVDDEGVVIDIDTPEAYHSVLAGGHGIGGPT